MPMEGDANDPLVAAAVDQLHAKAIEKLRQNKEFGLIVPATRDGETGVELLSSCGLNLLVEMHLMLTKHLTVYAVKDFLKNIGDDVEEYDVLSEYLNIDESKGGEGDTAGEA